jgi:dUTP pyrophosphatase
MHIKFIKLDPSIPDPAVAHVGDAGFDLYAREEVSIEPGKHTAIPTGMAFEIPDGYVGLIWDKSGLSTKFALKTLGGVIDAGYRGEVKVGMINLGTEIYTFKKGEKVAQMLIQKVETPTFVASESLSESGRGESGFGSTGK